MRCDGKDFKLFLLVKYVKGIKIFEIAAWKSTWNFVKFYQI